MEFVKRNIIFIVTLLVAVALAIGGILFFTKNDSFPQKTPNPILISGNSPKTGGIANGNYLPENPQAKVTLTEFGDYQCPACGAYNPLIIKLLTDFAGRVNFTFRDFAFIGPESLKASEASYCAADQGKYWQYHEYLYNHQNGENQGAFSDANLKSFAKTLELNEQTFGECLDSGKYKKLISDSNSAASSLGLNGVPSFFINSSRIDTPQNYEKFKKLIDDVLSGQK